jgi:tetratricopeptide (TPR) repeat protein
VSAGRRAAWIVALALVSAGAFGALYLRGLDYGLAWMDETEIGAGEIVLAPGEPWTAAFTRPLHRSVAGDPGANPYYRPLLFFVATEVHRLAGARPRAYRLVSFSAAVATCFGFGLLAWRLFGAPAPALAAVALAAVHPAGLEGWLWISGLGDALSTLFTIASLGLGVAAAARSGWRGAGAAAASILCFLLAVFAKEKGVVVPVLLAAILVALRFGARDRALAGPAALRRGAALVAVQLALVLAYVFVWRPAMLGRAVLAAPPIGGSRVHHVLSAVAAWPAALGWLLVPLHATTSDSVRIVTSLLDPAFWGGLALAGLSALACLALLRRGRAVAALGIAWIWIAFAPTANLFPQIHAHAERYLFLSVFGAALAVVALAREAPGGSLTALAIVAALGSGWAERTWTRTPAWRSTETLFSTDVARDPSFREGRFHLARTYFRSGRYAEADEQLRALTAPGAEAGRWSYVNAYGVRELVCDDDLALHRAAKVVEDQARLAASAPDVAAMPGLRACLGQAEEQLGHFERARAIYESVLAKLPGEPPATLSLSLARVYAQLGSAEEASRWLARARRDGPRDPTFEWQVLQVESRIDRIGGAGRSP